jgi:hypothetical protein
VKSTETSRKQPASSPMGNAQRIHDSVKRSIGEYRHTDYEKRGTMSQTILERSCHHITRQRFHQGVQQLTASRHPVRQGRSFQFDALALIDIALPVEGKMIRIF